MNGKLGISFVCSVTDPDKEDRMKRTLQQKTRKLSNTRFLDLGMSKVHLHSTESWIFVGPSNSDY